MEKLDEVFADIKQEGSDPFADMGEETPAESQTVKEPEEEIITTPKEEDNIPFHKHPRWIERENELQALRERDAERDRQIAELTAAQQSKTSTTIPDWFSELYGDNQPAWEKYSVHEQARTEEIEQRILARQQEEQAKAAKEEQFFQNWIDQEVAKLEAEGLKFDKNELMKTMLDYSPTDGNNNLDFKKGFAIYEALKKEPVNTEKSDARKQLADTTTTTSRSEPAKKDYMTPADLRNKSWSSL